MERTIIKDLIKWKSSGDRKPLVLKGARQVGKTYILEKFGQEYFKKYHYIDLRENKNIQNIPAVSRLVVRCVYGPTSRAYLRGSRRAGKPVRRLLPVLWNYGK